NVYGIIGIYLYKDRLDSVENKILLAILGDMSLALEKEKVIEDKNRANLKIKDEQFKTNLLRSISHDLRTPLTTICGDSDILLNNYKNLTESMKLELFQDIYDDSQWLLNLIENILSITRVEEGRMKLKIEPQIVEEVIDEALKHINRDKRKHNINVDIEDEYLMANMDVRLIIQVIINLVDNAIKYTDEGSNILIKAFKKDENTIIQICDDGNGIRDNDKEKIFRKFYTSNDKISDNKRSIGLGLYLCKIIVEAHGGSIKVEDNKPKGAIFTFNLKAL
ncbi:MAG: ATP-binding protein, partial [Klebsiella michiganensis]|nr:ATP-binding protein [Klebsiella michiganensis]MDU7560558.1 ATP-binding protein [Finegoldia magna]